MKLLQRGVALALLTTFTLASETALAYEQDKTYKLQFCIPMIIMGILAQ
ncbi:protein UshA precursor [includes: UDP-sugar hydrolase; 5'-nucleotidase] [Escherichia coli]|uniref:Protein UshA [includes: UDP-sugar hydrolase 5'-nucleotidase] n=1 Tax=Escherichia coli TaxID=562 RepID=A0A376X317_ECOLX|nr:protein UshA precursor [includes: UDP-sugar hydrolase; 5'-nucleotidase] [Escherichia coli]